MKYIASIAMIFGVIMGGAATKAQAQTHQRVAGLHTPAVKQNRSFLTIYGEARPPIGHVQYCSERPQACRNHVMEPRDAQLTAAMRNELERVNRWVNKTIEPVSDMEHYGVAEYWTIPVNGKGDCEDYALLKRKMLMERGFPESSLLMTVVRDKKGDGHAVLTVRTTDGDYVLDNVHDQVLTWHQTGYSFVKRQSQWNPSAWVALGEHYASDRPVASRQ